MTEKPLYDTAIIGGGLAGLALSIQLAHKGYQVILFEKENYPFHKVCGEYISMESFPFLESLGLPLSAMALPRINNLIVTAPDGEALKALLPLGGFGISRHKLDDMLKEIAVAVGVEVHQGQRVTDVHFADEIFSVETERAVFRSKVCCGSFGKKSNLDVKWNRPFTRQKSKRLNQFAGIKYHIETDFPTDTIALHNFKDGYCGISKIEDGKYCLCYLTHTNNLKNNQQSIEQLEAVVLSKNPHLHEIFAESKKLFVKPVAIAQISFLKKTQVEKHVLLLGDAAGMITPLCGNGMSMALHGSKLAAASITQFLQAKITREQLEAIYTRGWRKQFARRLFFGRLIQYFFGKVWMSNLFIRTLKNVPAFTQWLIRQTHGKTF